MAGRVPPQQCITERRKVLRRYCEQLLHANEARLEVILWSWEAEEEIGPELLPEVIGGGTMAAHGQEAYRQGAWDSFRVTKKALLQNAPAQTDDVYARRRQHQGVMAGGCGYAALLTSAQGQMRTPGGTPNQIVNADDARNQRKAAVQKMNGCIGRAEKYRILITFLTREAGQRVQAAWEVPLLRLEILDTSLKHVVDSDDAAAREFTQFKAKKLGLNRRQIGEATLPDLALPGAPEWDRAPGLLPPAGQQGGAQQAGAQQAQGAGMAV